MLQNKKKMNKDAFCVRFGTFFDVRNRTLLENFVRNYEKRLQIESVTEKIIISQLLSIKLIERVI